MCIRKFLLLAILIGVMAGCSSDDEDEIVPPEEKTVEEAPEEVDVVERTEETISDEDGSYIEITEEANVYQKTIHLPTVKSDSLQKELLTELESLEESFEETIEELSEGEAELKVSFTVNDMFEDLVIYEQVSEFKNTEKDKKIYHTFFELNGEHVTFEDLIDDSLEARHLFNHYIYNELINNVDSGIYIRKSSLHESIIESDEAFNKVTFDKDGLVFQFDTLEISGVSAGDPRVTVDYRVVCQLFKDDLMTVLDDEVDSWILEGETAGYTTPSIYDVTYISREVSDDKHLVALTFDDGPMPGTTDYLLDILKEKNVKATFFVLGSMVETYPELANRIVDEGHEIANHSYNHPEFVNLDPESIQYQIGRTQEAIVDATGVWPMTYRPPYGSSNEYVRQHTGLKEILWNIDTYDWQTRNRHDIYDSVVSTVGDGSVVLMHDVVLETPHAVNELLQDLDRDVYEFVTITELYEAREDDVRTFYDN